MKTTRQVMMIAILLAFGSHGVSAQEDLLQPRKDESLFGPYPLSQTVQGVTLATQAFAFLSLKPEGDALRINARIVADLSELQQKAGDLVNTIPLPTDNCAHYSLDNLVVRIPGKEITLSGNVATLRLKGDVDVWTCLEVPFGPFKTRSIPGPQPFKAAIPFRLAVVDSQTLAVELDEPDVDFEGDLGKFLEQVLDFFDVDINREVKKALNSAINPDLLKASLPEELRRLNPAITRAELLSNSGALAATLEMNTVVDIESLGDLVTALQKGAQCGK